MASNNNKRPGSSDANLHPPSKKPRTNNDRLSSASESLYVVADLIRARAREPGTKDEPILFYPSNGTEYVGYSPSDLDDLSDRAATYYSSIIPCRTSSNDASEVVALLGPSDLDYLIGLLALSKLGHTILFLSTRLAEEALVSLLKATNAHHLLTHGGFKQTGLKLSQHLPDLIVHGIALKADYGGYENLRPSNILLDSTRETNNMAWIIHSSGSTQAPKPIPQTHSAALGNFKSQFNLVGYVTVPLFHMQGLGCVFRSIMNRKRIYMYNAALPVTSQHLVKTLREHPDIQILYSVPYTVKLLADHEEGVELCRRLDVLFCSGAPCPKPVGDKLATGGVNLVSHFGSTETGQLMNSFRPPSEIKEWDWLRPSAALQPYLRWEPYDPENNIYELVVLEGWPSKVATNRDDGSYATSDLWERHADFPEKQAWRYYSRKDDTIVLVNGEKANPILFEGIARDSPLIDEAIVFGSLRPQLGLFVVAANPASSEEEIVNAIWPSVEKGNTVAPAHAQISKDMIRLLSLEDASRIRKTDKASPIRSAFYKDFAQLIDDTYQRSAKPFVSLTLDEPSLRSFLREQLQDVFHSEQQRAIRDDTDLFSLGMDSLQASRVRTAILGNINVGGRNLPENFVFEFPSISAMATELVQLRAGEAVRINTPVEERMQALLDTYGSNFETHTPKFQLQPYKKVVVTGATGSLGAHLVAQLTARPYVRTVICLVRAQSDAHALQRLRQSLQDRNVEADAMKVRAYASNLGDDHLGLSEEVYQNITNSLTAVIHCAWDVNFNMGLASFEHDCIRGTRKLIDLCLRSSKISPADLIFCSSVSTVANTPEAEVPEDWPPSLNVAQGTGYAQSKLVAELMLLRATEETELFARVLRIGQVVGDTKFGIWNRQEAIPMILQSSATIGALPKLDEKHSWLPVDTVARAVVENTLDHDRSGVFHIVNKTTFHWTKTLLPYLKKAGLGFDTVSPGEWLERLRKRPDPVANPPYRLMDFFEAKYGGQASSRQERVYASDKAREASPALAGAQALNQNMVNKLVQYVMAPIK